MTQARRGVIYILTNPLIPGIVKIGRTARSVTERVREISRPTGVPADYEVIYDQVVGDAHAAEKEIHTLLRPHRINPQKEFFQTSVREAIHVVQDIAARYPIDEAQESVEFDALPALEDRMRRWLRRDLVSVKFVQFSDLCLIKWVIQPDFRELAAYENIFDLGVFGDGDCDHEELFCPSHNPPKENFKQFLELDSYSMIFTGLNILTEEASDYVAHLWEERKIHSPVRLKWNVVDTAYDMMGPEVEWRNILAKYGVGGRSSNVEPSIVPGVD
ncbi:GIY-YIG nuclease family protein [Streptomyces blastmyceticus]|uniref:Bacteriophage T5 Orf172 DNA-binding domain-containing protein n=1 Tax=Streptomyces blastmyceticus TaxID=68180 RepID=A0ABN0XTU8_9ACTN